jgi:hypothetical protein
LAGAVDSRAYYISILAAVVGRYTYQGAFSIVRAREFFFLLLSSSVSILFILQEGEGGGGVDLQLYDSTQRVRGEAHAGAARRVAE